MIWLISPLAHTATQVITKQRDRACFLSSDASSYGQVEDHDAMEGKGDKKMKRWLGTHACM
jgi:hypothetical protein